MDINIRPALESDYDFILDLNEVNVEVLSPMDRAKLAMFDADAEQLLVAEVDGERAAFLVGLCKGIPWYTSENYRWFSEHYDSFLYVDRIVIGESFRHFGLGRRMYEYVFAHAREIGIPYMVAEIDTIPYNATSLEFHKAMGFREVGEQVVRGGSIRVSLQEAPVPGI